MGSVSLDDISVTPLKRIAVSGGDVLHVMKHSEDGFAGFGEAYFSQVVSGAVKAWKRHRQMTLNLVVPIGEVHFIFIDSTGSIREEKIGDGNYARLTVPPSIWFGFKGVSKSISLLLNIADIEHMPDEVERKELSDIKYDWSAI